MAVTEPQSARDYGDRTTAAVKSVLIEIGQILGSFQGKFAVIGGAVPWLLLSEADMPHSGTMDVDLGLDPSALGDGQYVRLVEALQTHGYHQRDNLRRFQLVRAVPAKDGGPDIDVVVDFLMPRDAKIAKNTPPLISNFAVQRADGAELALSFYQMVAIEGDMPDGASNRVHIAVASIPALLAMKGYAIENRLKRKDAYDIYYSVRNFPGGIDGLVEATELLLDVESAKIRAMDMPVLDRVFDMEGGYVLDFSNRTFAEFFREELRVNIDHPRWAVHGGSKAKRLRYYLRQANPQTALDTLSALWEYREASRVTRDYPELDERVRAAFFRIFGRLSGTPPASETAPTTPAQTRIDAATASSLAERLLDVSKLDPQPRGYAFEKFLKDMFDAYGLSARPSFRLVGEQIDGSFVSGGDTYLLEARWRNDVVDASTLRAFNAKVEDKARWSRGLLLSYSGFSSEGLAAFGRGNSVICMDGRDLHDVLSRRLDLTAVLGEKARRAAETGQPFVRVDDLRPISSS